MGYRETVLDPAKKDSDHPINHGIKMQVHHLLSQQGFIKSGRSTDLESYGYDINVRENLVALPNEMDAACYLRVQVHRGNHPSFIDNNDSDSDHPKTYHNHIADILEKATDKLEEKCATGNEKTVKKYLRLHSLSILEKISKFEIPISKPFMAFQENEPGCGGETSTVDLFKKYVLNESKTCNRNQDHLKYNSFKEIPYKLKLGK